MIVFKASIIRKNERVLPGAVNKKAPPVNQKSFTIKKVVSFDLTYLSPRLRSGVGTLYLLLKRYRLSRLQRAIPSAFLDK